MRFRRTYLAPSARTAPLATWTEMGGSAAENDAFDGSFATNARLAFAVVDAVKELEAAFFAVGVDVVSQGAASVIDRAAENQFDGAIEAEDLLASQPIGGDCGINPRVKERLVGVNVADAGDQTLIEQSRLDSAAGFGESRNQLSRADLQRLRAEICVMCLTIAEPPDAAKAARVAKTQLEI